MSQNTFSRLRSGPPLVAIVASGSLLGGTASDTSGLAVAVLGLLCLGAAGVRASRRLLGVGGVGITAGILLAGTGGAESGGLVLATIGGLLLWVRTESAVTRSGRSRRRDRVPALSSGMLLLSVGVPALLALGVYRTVTGGPPPVVVAVLLVGATVLISLDRVETGSKG